MCDMRDRAHRRDQDTDGSEPRALCESHSGGAVRWTRGAGRTLPAVLCLPAVLLLLLPIATGQDCPKNPKSQQKCSGDRTVAVTSSFIPVAKPAGVCHPDGTCVCENGYTSGPACEYITQAGKFGHESHTLNATREITFNNWRYLAKTCWGANVDGSLQLELSFTDMNCILRDCRNGFGIDYRKAVLPDILFYASYDDNFALANMAQESWIANTTGEAGEAARTNCLGRGAIFRERMTCSNYGVNGTTDICTMKKTYNVMNRANSGTLVYLVVSGPSDRCNLQGRVDWGIKVSVRGGEKGATHAVCGARGSKVSQRCFTDSGGSCAVQEPHVLYNQRTMEMKGKISRAHVALGAVVFCSVITVGIAGIKYHQSRHKRARLRRNIPMTNGPQMPAAVSGGSELPVDDEGSSFQTNGDSVQAHQLVVSAGSNRFG